MQLTDNKKYLEKEKIKKNEELIFTLSLARISFLTFEEKQILQKNLDSSQSLALLFIEDIESFIHRNVGKSAIWNGEENLRMARNCLYYCELLKIKILPYYDSDYPEILRQISDPPYVLFCKGDFKLLKKRNVSIVGSRRISPLGRKAAYDFAYAAALDGCNVISGLANGADGFAHLGAVNAFLDVKNKSGNLENIGKTIAVLPGSIDEIIPYGHKKLAAQILQCGGCLISEYEPKMSMAKWHFVHRNRIIAGLSAATVVIEAPPGSGSLITAEFALDYNRDVVFHEATFGNMAKQISEIVHHELECGYSKGNVTKHKFENRPEKFIEDGAQVIKNYDDFCQYLKKAPGLHNLELQQKIQQGELF